MDLKESLKKDLVEEISGLESQLTQTKNSLAALDTLDLDNASYKIDARQLFTPSNLVTIRHTGTLKDSILKARKEYDSKYPNTDYVVSPEIKIGEEFYVIDDEFYELSELPLEKV